MKIDLEFSNTIPDNCTPLEAVAMVKCLDEDGDVTWFRISTDALNLMESLGMLRSAVIVLEDTVRESFMRDDDGEDK